jgi:hypothetical protein
LAAYKWLIQNYILKIGVKVGYEAVATIEAPDGGGSRKPMVIARICTSFCVKDPALAGADAVVRSSNARTKPQCAGQEMALCRDIAVRGPNRRPAEGRLRRGR